MIAVFPCQPRNRRICLLIDVFSDRRAMNGAAKEREPVERMRRFVKAELKRADLTYEELAERLRAHGLEETKGSIAAKINRGSFPATFFVMVMKAIGREQINLADV
jgi:hypothetical protein